ncbi:prepilin peptidase [Novisyntrophococcus fermenticellae]|uniref:prepilin peptidase n=1 Tax=Novisyntrophococcus fermenticellae TaxID=2068655 RepID=UPI001E2F2B77|nr:prepilin peptidase [Novisyntrophococcus fermenticellae]
MDWKSIVTLGLLTVNTWRDIRRREIYLLPTVFYGIWGLILTFYSGNIFHWEVIADLLPGLILLLIGKVSGGKVGYGDGLLVLSFGVWNGFKNCIFTLAAALMLAFLWSAFSLLKKSLNKNSEIPFVPFLLISYILMFRGF